MTDEDLKNEILESKDDLAIAVAHNVPEKRVKDLRKQIEASLASVPPVKTPKEIIAEEKEVRAAKEAKKDESIAKETKAKEPRFLMRDPATGFTRELKRVNSSCDIYLLVPQ